MKNAKALTTRPVLDMTCGGRMMWFDHEDDRAVFIDNRKLSAELCDGRTFTISPDVVADFRDLPFDDDTFRLVIFDPPHLENLGKTSWLAMKYGALLPSWKDDLRAGFAEAFRVLMPGGILIFKWSEVQIPLAEILKLTPARPLVGHTGTNPATYWVTFLKENNDNDLS